LFLGYINQLVSFLVFYCDKLDTIDINFGSACANRVVPYDDLLTAWPSELPAYLHRQMTASRILEV